MLLIDIFEDVFQGEAQRRADDPHPLHRGQALLAAFLQKADGILDLAQPGGELVPADVKDRVAELLAFAAEFRKIAPFVRVFDVDQIADALVQLLELLEKIVHGRMCNGSEGQQPVKILLEVVEIGEDAAAGAVHAFDAAAVNEQPRPLLGLLDIVAPDQG